MLDDHNNKPMRATEAATLEQLIMEARFPKNEREWWAKNEIDRLRAALKEIELRTSSYRDRHDEWPLAAGVNFEARKALGLSH